MDNPAISASQAIYDLQILRRRASMAQEEFSLSRPEIKLITQQAEERLKAINGLDLALALIEFGRTTGRRVRI